MMMMGDAKNLDDQYVLTIIEGFESATGRYPSKHCVPQPIWLRYNKHHHHCDIS